jgi:hypothetical protein
MDRNVVVVMAKCCKTRGGFGIRFERISPRQWSATWAFALKEGAAEREGYDRTEVTGAFVFDPLFPGCPHCRSRSFFRCGCGRVSCWSGDGKTVVCPWCSAAGEVSGEVSRLSAGGDR